MADHDDRELKGAVFEMDAGGNFRIQVKANQRVYQSPWAGYNGVAVLHVGSETYYGVSDYYAGMFPTERVFRIVEFATEKLGLPNG